MKKFTLLTIALAVASVLMLSACDGEPSDTEDTADTTVTQETTAAPADDTTAQPEETTVSTPEKVTYTVTVTDQDGNPVAGVEVQMCSDAGCKLPSATDANGVVTFTYSADDYHITVVSCPEGYTADAEEHYFDGATEMTVTITRN